MQPVPGRTDNHADVARFERRRISASNGLRWRDEVPLGSQV
jgi:hypothetical protein